jgi:hypothetical protein
MKQYSYTANGQPTPPMLLRQRCGEIGFPGGEKMPMPALPAFAHESHFDRMVFSAISWRCLDIADVIKLAFFMNIPG